MISIRDGKQIKIPAGTYRVRRDARGRLVLVPEPEKPEPVLTDGKPEAKIAERCGI